MWALLMPFVSPTWDSIFGKQEDPPKATWADIIGSLLMVVVGAAFFSFWILVIAALLKFVY